MKQLMLSAAGATLVAGAAEAAVIDFEEFAHGETVTTVTAGGATATVSVDSAGAFDQAVAFDTDLANTADPDLEAPFAGSGSEFPGKVLVISEDGGPDDERLGGVITFTFDQLVDLLSFEAFDGGRFEVTAAGGASEIVVPGDNQSGSLEFGEGFTGISAVSFGLFDSGEGASGAIDNITIGISDVSVAPIPVPAGLPLLAAGLGGLVLMGRRRRA